MSTRTTKATRAWQPSDFAVIGWLAVVLVQGFHELEHVIQVIQRFVGIGDGFFNNPKGAGILGTWLDIEPVHLGYNFFFLGMIALCFWASGYMKKRYSLTFWLMSFTLAFQGYHFVEHVVKIVQFIDTGKHGTPGILGHFFNLAWLHFSYNTITYVPLLVTFFVDGYPGRIAPALLDYLRSIRGARPSPGAA